MPEELISVLADEVQRRLGKESRLRRSPELHWIRWVAIGMAIGNMSFAKKLSDTVDIERAFGPDEESEAANCAMLMALDAKQTARPIQVLSEVLGIVLRDGEKLSDGILRSLKREDEEAWGSRNDRAMALYRECSAALAKLMTIARGKSPQRLMAEGEID